MNTETSKKIVEDLESVATTRLKGEPRNNRTGGKCISYRRSTGTVGGCVRENELEWG